jgi:snRNA-activating protein complex (SNAPc), subunit 3
MSGQGATLREFRADWRILQEAVTRSLRVCESLPNRPASLDDPFDCKDLLIPPLHTLVDQLADESVHRWKTLDHRKVVGDGERPQWYQRRVRLPENFRFDREPEENPATDERVISLENPADTLPYSSELRKLFAQVPTIAKLREKTFRGHGLHRVAAIVEGDNGNARKRLRLSQQHDVVPQSARPLVATMRIECWKKRPSSESVTDKNRLVLEFSETQTLLDVHIALVTIAAVAHRGETADEQGFFLIEGIFYVSTETLSLSSIVDWLKLDEIRSKHAGIDISSIIVKNMVDTNLCDLKCRLGVRYCHQSSSSFESAVFVTDRRMTSSGHYFPIIHDVWLHSDVTCDVCLNQPASRATATTSSLGHRALCTDCCRLLRVPDTDQRCYTVWESG